MSERFSFYFYFWKVTQLFHKFKLPNTISNFLPVERLEELDAVALTHGQVPRVIQQPSPREIRMCFKFEI